MNVVITGASKGIGFAIAEKFAANNCNLYLCAKTETDLLTAQEVLKKKFPDVKVHAICFDLSKDAKKFGEWILEQTNEIDILINNAGYFLPGKIYSEPDGLLEQQIATNLYSAYHLTKKLLPAMMERKAGHVFNICSVAGLQPYENGGAYSISKFALNGFSKNLREEMKPYNIKVTTIYPGAVLTNSWGNFDNSSNRIMDAKDIAEIIFSTAQLSPSACVEEILIRPQLGDL